jgi:type 1 glutamine amidotransferase
MKNSLKIKAFSVLMLLLISMSVAAYLGHGFSSNSVVSPAQLKQTSEFEAASEQPLRIAIECANSSYSRDDPNNDPVYSMQKLFERRGYETAIVNGTDIDTLAELNNYDVVVIGGSGHYNDTDFSVFQSALKEWVQNGGGVVATGWILYEMDAEGVVGGDLDQILPVSPPYDFGISNNITMISENNSITQGIDPFPYDYVEFPYSHVADPGATVLGFTISNGSMNATTPAIPMPVVASWSYVLGKTVYLGPTYLADFGSFYNNQGLYTDVDAVRLLLNSVEWVAGRTPKPIVAECLILSNRMADTCALDFTLKIPDIDFAWMDVSSETPTYSNLSAYDVVLLFEDGLFDNAPNVGSAVYDYVMAGGNLVIGTFYEQDRSDCFTYGPNGWGPLETIDPFTSDTIGCEYSNDTLDVSSLITHPITSGVQNLWCDQNRGYHGGVHAKPDTVVVANWTGPNYLGEPCPLAGYRILEDNQRVVQISIYPNYAYYNTTGTEVGGDFYTLWANAIKWASEALYTGPQILKELTQISTGHQEEAPSIALDHNDNLHIVWIGNYSSNLYYMMVDRYGNTLINETCLDPSPNATAKHARRTSIAIDSVNNVHIVFHSEYIYEPWPEYPNSTTLDAQEVLYLKINPYLDDMNGSSADYTAITVIPEKIISTDDGNKSRAANIAVDSADNLHVAWFDKDIWSSNGELHYLVMDRNGNVVVPETNVTGGFRTDVDWSEPEIVVDSQGNAHVFFVTSGWTNSDGWRDIWYTMIDGSTGNVLINNTQLTNSSQTWRYSRPFVDIDSEDMIHIVWHDSRFYQNATGEHEIFYMKIDPYLDDRNGNSANPEAIKVVDEMLISEGDGVRSFLANIAVDKYGMAHLAWVNEYLGSWSGYNDIYYSLVNATGDIVIPEHRITYSNGTLDFNWWTSGGAFASNRNPVIAIADGRVFIVDKARDPNTDYQDIWLTIAFVDKIPPSTSIGYTAYSSAGKDWLSADSSISLLAIDEESNVTATYYQIDADSWQPYDQPFNLSGLDDGSHTIQFYSIDYFGNEEDVKTQAVYLDTTEPNIDTPTRYPPGDIEFGQAVTISVNVTDSGSGVKEVLLQYSLNNGTSWTNVTMIYNSTSGLYEGTIPAQSTNLTVKYAISANDNVDNNAVQDNLGLYYSYPVIPEFPSITLIAIFMLLSLSATILIKKRRKIVVL